MPSSIEKVSLKTVLKSSPPEVTWVWEPYIPDGSLCLLSAYMKVGKSTLAYAMATAVASGQPFLGYRTRQCPVLMLAVEEHIREVAHRFESFGAHADSQASDNIFIHNTRLDPTVIVYRDLMDAVKELGAGLIVVDTLASWWNVEDENDNAMVKRAVMPLLQVARDTGAAVLLIHHTGKADQGGGRAIRGASSLFALVDQALILKQSGGDDSPRRVLEARGRFEQTPAKTTLELGDDNVYRLVQGHGQAYAAALGDCLRLAGRPMTIQDLAATTGIQERLVRRHLPAVPGLTATGSGVKGDPRLYAVAFTD